MEELLIRHAIVGGERRSIRIRGGSIVEITAAPEPGGTAGPAAGVRVIEAEGLHAFPSFKNAHTHVPMVLFRGYGDDMPLMEWLQTRIWPAEAQLTEQDVYFGARLGILEMIRGGTTFFNEMYWHRPGIVRAVEEMGVRSLIGQTLIGVGDPAVLEAQQRDLLELAARPHENPRVQLGAAPHAIYTVPEPVLRWVGEVAAEHDLLVHIHLSETAGEVEECIAAHGCRPAQLLDRVGLVNSRLIAVHGQFLDADELALLGAAGATLVTNPAANLKLATGGIFPYRAARAAGIRVCLGTDGAASNNTLSMLEAMKLAALLQKHRESDATELPASQALEMATTAASEAFRLGPGGLVSGAPADLVLMDFSAPSTQPVHDPVSALVYAAGDAHVHTTICDGRVLMHERKVEVCDEAEVIAAAVEVARQRLRS
ncbi:MAG TPA: amidohydrolase [Longimicrobiales bacterium]